LEHTGIKVQFIGTIGGLLHIKCWRLEAGSLRKRSADTFWRRDVLRSRQPP
jgi:hypothetical protein